MSYKLHTGGNKMEYKSMTQEQKDIRQKEWEKVLDTYCSSYIVEDEDGEEIDYGKPCDQGAPCDRCHYDYHLNLQYTRNLKALGLPLTDEEIEKYGEELEG